MQPAGGFEHEGQQTDPGQSAPRGPSGVAADGSRIAEGLGMDLGESAQETPPKRESECGDTTRLPGAPSLHPWGGTAVVNLLHVGWEGTGRCADSRGWQREAVIHSDAGCDDRGDGGVDGVHGKPAWVQARSSHSRHTGWLRPHLCEGVRAEVSGIQLHFVRPGLTDPLRPLDGSVFGAPKAEYRIIIAGTCPRGRTSAWRGPISQHA